MAVGGDRDGDGLRRGDGDSIHSFINDKSFMDLDKSPLSEIVLDVFDIFFNASFF